MTKKIRILTVSLALAAALVLGGTAIRCQNRAQTYKMKLNSTYRHAFTELVDGVSEMSAGLTKSLYSTSPGAISANCAHVFAKAQTSQMAMGLLPFNGELEKTASFLSCAGDYAYMLARSSHDGYTEEELANLEAIAKAAEEISESLIRLMGELDRGELTLYRLEKADEAADTQTLDDGIKNMESEFPEIPALIYDGPFSSHLEKAKPLLLYGLEEISREEGAKAVSELTGISAGSLILTGERGGNLPAYVFKAETTSGTLFANVSKQGGVIIEIMHSRRADETVISQEDAVEKAREFLEKAGYNNMKESYYMTTGNVCTVNFAYTEGDVICYPDLVKVSVAMDNGDVIGFEAMGYIMSHTERDIPDAAVSLEEAEEAVPKSIKILSSGIAIIPTDGKYEKLCYEFICENEEGQHYIIYVNAETGEEEKILILIESESGTLTR